jgi:carboxypeptidase C (cathepsin A)
MTSFPRVFFLLATAALSAVLAPAPAVLADPPAAKDKDDKTKDEFKPSVTEHAVTIGGQTIKYRVTAGLSPLMDDKLKTKARAFSIAYERLSDGDEKDKDGKPLTLAAKEPGKRPVTFAFNGGPGSSSVWLHMGALGPRRVALGKEGETVALPALADNADSWLDFTDLVFIDPVSTGYSRPAEGEDPNQFHGLDEDVHWVGEFIRLYLVRSQRWLSPKYLAGESYGTTRAAHLSAELQGHLGINLSGIVLVSPVLNFQTLGFDSGNDTAYWLYLPSYTAAAFHHKKLAPPLDQDLDKTLEQARAWAESDYLIALGKGDALTPQQRDETAARLAAFTGLSVEFVKRSNLRIAQWAFAKELLRDRAQTIGRYDARYTGVDRNQNGTSTEYDPSYAAVQGPYTACFNAYVRGDLGFESDLNYEILTGAVHPWNFGGARNRYPDVTESLRSSMTENPALRVLVASGYFDLATPYAAMTYTMNHMGLGEAARKNINQTFYHAGHMMYLREEDLHKLRQDVAGFYAGKP